MASMTRERSYLFLEEEKNKPITDITIVVNKTYDELVAQGKRNEQLIKDLHQCNDNNSCEYFIECQDSNLYENKRILSKFYLCTGMVVLVNIALAAIHILI